MIAHRSIVNALIDFAENVNYLRSENIHRRISEVSELNVQT